MNKLRIASVLIVTIILLAAVGVAIPKADASNAYGITSVRFGYGSVAPSPGQSVQYQALVYTSSGNIPQGIPLSWYADGVDQYDDSTGGSGQPGTSYFNAAWSQGCHSLYFVAGGIQSSTLSIAAGSSCSSSTTSTTSSSTTSSTTAICSSGPNAFYSGAISTDSNLLSNNGVRATIEVLSQNITGMPSGAWSTWIDEYLPNNGWAQGGYFLRSGVAWEFFQVWNLTNNNILASWSTPIYPYPQTQTPDAYHTFEISAIGNVWNFKVDNVTRTSYVGISGISSSSSQSHMTVEQSQVASPCSFQPIRYDDAMQYLKGGTWHRISSANTWANPSIGWNVQGQKQSSSLDTEQIIIGGIPTVLQGIQLWNGTG